MAKDTKRKLKRPSLKIEEQPVPAAPVKGMDEKVYSIAFVIGVVILVIVFSIAFYSSKKKSELTKKAASTQMESKVELPASWSLLGDTAGAEQKAEKKTENGFKPTVVLIKSKTQEQNPEEYIEKLIQGAKSALPTLQITNDVKTQRDGFTARVMQGNYYNGNEKIYLKQTVLMKGEDVYTLTGSYNTQDGDLEKQIDQVFEYLYENNIR